MLVPDDYSDVHRAVLRALAVQVIATLDPQHSMEQLIKNPVTLHSYVSKMRVNWPSIAKDLGMTRASVYHWYNETHLRRISGIKMTAEDKKIIKDAIIKGIETQTILEDGFQMTIRNLFESKYPRQEIMMTYNNMLRSRDIQRILDRKKITLPTKRHSVSVISKAKQQLDEQKSGFSNGFAADSLTNSVDQLSISSYTPYAPIQSPHFVSQTAFPMGLSTFPPVAATTTAATAPPPVAVPSSMLASVPAQIPGQAPGISPGWSNMQMPIQAPVAANPNYMNSQSAPYQWLMYWLPNSTPGNNHSMAGMPSGNGFNQPYQPPMFPPLDYDVSSVYKN